MHSRHSANTHCGGYPRAAKLRPRNVMVHVTGAMALLLMLGHTLGWISLALASLGPLGSISPLLLGTLVGLFVADLSSGLAHWAFDTWFDEGHPIFHRMVLVVREHHIAPQAMFTYPFYADSGQLSLLATAFAAPILIPISVWGQLTGLLVGVMWASVVAAVCFVFMLEFHKLGHRAKSGRIATCLQRARLLLRPTHHWKHHRGCYDSHYCLINGWGDSLMERIDGWRMLERLIHRLTGAVPRQNDHEWLRSWLSPRRRAMWSRAVQRRERHG